MPMKLILLKDVVNLGKTGEVVAAKEGYARNYLVPCGLALPATDRNIKAVEFKRKQRIEETEKEKQEAKRLADLISRASCTIAVEAGKDDKLFGSITAIDIQKALEAEGIVVDKKKIDMKEHINQTGIYQIPIRLHSDAFATLKLWVVKK